MSQQVSRRRFLSRAVGFASAVAASRVLAGLSVPLITSACGGSSSGSTTTGASVVANPNASTLPIPPLDTGTLLSGVRTYNLTMQTGTSELIPGVQTPTLGYNGSVLGPTLRLTKGEAVALNVSNAIGEVTTTHWHGMHLPAVMDGGPHQEIPNGTTWTASFNVLNDAATLWYHPHTHGQTGAQVFQGLAGMIIVDDAAANGLNLPTDYGVDDIPLVIQDRRFASNGTLAYRTQAQDQMGMKGDRILVNGKETPRLNAPAQWVRLRILNGSNARIYNVGFGDNRNFVQIASDGGLLTAPVTLNRVLLSPGERAEIMVDLSQDLNTTLALRSYSSEVVSSLYMMGGGGGGGMGGGGMGGMTDALDNSTFDLMTILVDRAAVNNPTLPGSLNTIPTLTASAPDRLFTLERRMGTFTINNKAMDLNRIDETISLGATEIWQVSNNHGMPHPFHIHDELFQIISRNGVAPAANEQGWKDTVLLKPREVVRFIVKFNDYADTTNPFMYHCHILEHEDNAMMGQFVVV